MKKKRQVPLHMPINLCYLMTGKGCHKLSKYVTTRSNLQGELKISELFTPPIESSIIHIKDTESLSILGKA